MRAAFPRRTRCITIYMYFLIKFKQSLRKYTKEEQNAGTNTASALPLFLIYNHLLLRRTACSIFGSSSSRSAPFVTCEHGRDNLRNIRRRVVLRRGDLLRKILVPRDHRRKAARILAARAIIHKLQ